MNLIEQIKADVAGAALLKDWLGSNASPVGQVTAESRAATCLSGDGGKPCPLNMAPGWWEKTKSLIADTIKKQLSLKHRMKLSVVREGELNICKPCGCCLRLAVWVPIERLLEHTTKEQLKNMPDFCWKKNEIGEQSGL